MKRNKLLIGVLTLVLICVFALPALAAGSSTYSNTTALYNYLHNEKGYNVKLQDNILVLQQNITIADSYSLVFSAVSNAEEVTIDLNGYTISGTPELPLLMVKKGILTLMDSSEAKTGRVENTSRGQGFAIGADGEGLLIVKGGNYAGEFAIYQGGGEIDIFSGAFSGEDSGARLFGGELNIYGGQINGNFAAINNQGSKVFISGGSLYGDYHGIYATAGELNFTGSLSITAERWDGVFCERVKPVFSNIIKGNISGGRYGISVQGEGLIFELVDNLAISGRAAAIMLETQTEDSKISLSGSLPASGQVIVSELSGLKYKYFSTISTDKQIGLTNWQDTGIAVSSIPGGMKEVTIMQDGQSNLDAASEWAKPLISQAITLGLVPHELRADYQANTTRAEFCALAVAVYESIKGEAIAERKQFADTGDINVQKMGALAVVQGVGEDKFNPNSSITRQEAAIMLANLMKALDKPLAEVETSFADKESIADWAVKEVGQVQAAGIMDGMGDNMFSPKSNYTMEQSIATMLRIYQRF